MLERNEFHDWLKSKPPTVEVGNPCSPDHCPIAIFLADRWDTSATHVGTESFGVDERRHPLPDWALGFVSVVDLQDEETYVTAEHALEILNSIA